MSQRCDICGKGPQFGRAVSFSKRATNRRFNPNISMHKVFYKGSEQRLKVCANCLRTLNKVKKGRFAASLQTR